MTYTDLTEAQQERACIIWEGHYGCDESRWQDAVEDAANGQNEKQAGDLPDWLE